MSINSICLFVFSILLNIPILGSKATSVAFSSPPTYMGCISSRDSGHNADSSSGNGTRSIQMTMTYNNTGNTGKQVNFKTATDHQCNFTSKEFATCKTAFETMSQFSSSAAKVFGLTDAQRNLVNTKFAEHKTTVANMTIADLKTMTNQM